MKKIKKEDACYQFDVERIVSGISFRDRIPVFIVFYNIALMNGKKINNK